MCAHDGADVRFPRAAETVSVLGNVGIAPGVFSLVASRMPLRGSGALSAAAGGSAALPVSVPAPRPGQFFMLRARPSGVFLGRPISVYRSDETSVTFLILSKGEGTAELCALRPGDRLDLVGPVGNTFRSPPELVRAAASGKADDGSPLSDFEIAAIGQLPKLPRIAVIGGGIGVAPVAGFALADSGGLVPGSFDFFASFRSAPYGLDGLESRARRLFVTTEDGSAGVKGMLPAVFNPADYDLAYACGPTPMLKYVKESCAGLLAYISLERRMACGAGACLGCTIETTGGNRRCCVDGPVFTAAEVIF